MTDPLAKGATATSRVSRPLPGSDDNQAKGPPYPELSRLAREPGCCTGAEQPLAARPDVTSVQASLSGVRNGAGDCTAPERVSVIVPGPIAPGDMARFQLAFEEAALQLPEHRTDAHYDVCARWAWEQCFAPPAAALSAREQVWAAVPAWCWVDEPFNAAFTRLFDALPENCSDAALAAALEEAWELTQGDNWL